ncbi:MAG: MG2 domain-containing protein, partial [Pseudomonadota bacterium]
MEAERVRFEVLHNATSDQAKATVRDTWSERVAQLDQTLPWWSMAAATAASMHQQNSAAADHLISAHALAKQAAELFPESLGGQRAASIQSQIEMPIGQLSGMSSDAADRRSLQVTHANLTQVHFAAKKLPVPARGPLPLLRLTPQRQPDLLREPDVEWSVGLPQTTDFKQHQTFVTPPMTEPGVYLVWMSTTPRPRAQDWMVSSIFVLSDIVLLTQQLDRVATTDSTTTINSSTEYRVVSGSNGAPVSDATVTLYRRERGRVVPHAQASTDTLGLARLDTRAPQRGLQAVASRGEHFAISGRYASSSQYATSDQYSLFLYTDRSTYRPNQKLLFKVVAYNGRNDPASYALAPDVSINVSLRDANGEEVATATLDANGFGSASGEFTLPPGRLLGSWSLQATIPESRTTLASSQIRVEEYKRPTFEVTIDDSEQPLRLNRPAQLNGSARYYFGLPVASGAVSWSVTREPVYPPWWGWYRGFPQRQGTQTIAQGEAALDADGKFTVDFVPEADEADEAGDAGVTYSYRLSADVTDEGGETRSAERSFRLGLVSVEAEISSSVGFVRHELLGSTETEAGADADATLWSFQRRDLNGVPRAGAAQWRLARLEQPNATLAPSEQPIPAAADPNSQQTPGDTLRPRQNPSYQAAQVLRSWEAGDVVSRG